MEIEKRALIANVRECGRCGGAHTALEFEAADENWTFSAMCPRQNKPILTSGEHFGMGPYQTHQPLLFACARHAIDNGGRVIELGCGMHSTPQLAALLGDRFTSYETDREWAKKMRRFGANVVEIDKYEDVPVKPYAMVFIDAAPEWERPAHLARFVDSRLVVVHDSDIRYTEHYGLEKSLALFPYRIDYTFASPNTTVVSRDREAIGRIAGMFK